MNQQLAEDLDALYSYMLKRMMDANLKNDTAPLVEVKQMLSDLRATWAQAIDINKQEQREAAGAEPAAPGAPYKSLAVAM